MTSGIRYEKFEKAIKISASNPFGVDCEFRRVVLRRISLKGSVYFQAEKFAQNKVFHENIKSNAVSEWVARNLEGKYKQVCFVYTDADVTYLISAKGKVKRLEKATAKKELCESINNRKKKYLLNEGDDIPFLIDLGVFTQERKIVNSMYDKFRQINRFTEILNDVFKDYAGQSLTLLDFGCGKSYLTFAIYYYFAKIRKVDVKIIGYDLKSDVVDKCNSLSVKYGYSGLHFVVADVTRDVLYDEHIDAVVSLHACDIATDYALYYAVKHNVKYIFSVPCCQHEVNNSITRGGELDIMLKYGIIKERASALLTDSVRATLLEDEGYSVDIIEFVDLEHSPKNLMIRAIKTMSGKKVKNADIEALMKKYKFEQTLFRLLRM